MEAAFDKEDIAPGPVSKGCGPRAIKLNSQGLDES